jgi:hypothetical protein
MDRNQFLSNTPIVLRPHGTDDKGPKEIDGLVRPGGCPDLTAVVSFPSEQVDESLAVDTEPRGDTRDGAVYFASEDSPAFLF